MFELTLNIINYCLVYFYKRELLLFFMTLSFAKCAMPLMRCSINKLMQLFMNKFYAGTQLLHSFAKNTNALFFGGR